MEYDIGGRIYQISNLLRREAQKTPYHGMVEEMTASHGYIVHFLYAHRNEEIFQRDLEQKFTMRRSSVTNVVQLMERNGLIERVPVERDARMKRLVLTPLAIEMGQMICDGVEETERRLVAGIPSEELGVFSVTLQKIKENLENGLFCKENKCPAKKEEII